MEGLEAAFEAAAFEIAKDAGSVESFSRFLELYPDGQFVEQAMGERNSLLIGYLNKNPDPDLIRNFMIDHPGVEISESMQTALIEDEFKRAKQSEFKWNWEIFLRIFPENEKVVEAEGALVLHLRDVNAKLKSASLRENLKFLGHDRNVGGLGTQRTDPEFQSLRREALAASPAFYRSACAKGFSWKIAGKAFTAGRAARNEIVGLLRSPDSVVPSECEKLIGGGYREGTRNLLLESYHELLDLSEKSASIREIYSASRKLVSNAEKLREVSGPAMDQFEGEELSAETLFGSDFRATDERAADIVSEFKKSMERTSRKVELLAEKTGSLNQAYEYFLLHERALAASIIELESYE